VSFLCPDGGGAEAMRAERETASRTPEWGGSLGNRREWKRCGGKWSTVG
jgi:hypothetical protein